MSTVLVFRSELLAISETFIRAQALALKRFDPYYVGLQRTNPTLELSPNIVSLAKENGVIAALRSKVYRMIGFAPSLYRRARALRPSLLHAHFATDGVIAMPLAKSLHIPMVVTLHGIDITLLDKFRTSLEARRYLHRRSDLWERASVFICVSEFIRQKALQIGFPENKLRVHYIGIDLNQFVFKEKRSSEKVILFVGRLVEKKGVSFLIKAMQKVQQRHPDAKLVIVGHGVLHKSLESLSRTLGISCEFLGGQPATVVREWLARAAIFCIPSVTAATGDSEGLGMVALEAQAMGVPVVGYRHGGIPEMVEHEKSGLLAKEGDSSELAACICRFLEDPALAEKCRQQAAMQVSRRFDLATQTAELETIYENVVSRRQ